MVVVSLVAAPAGVFDDMAKMTLDDLVAQLRAAYGDALRAIVLYGSAAGGEHHAKHSDYNVLVLVRDLSAQAMRAAGAAAGAWDSAGQRPALTLTDAEWRSSVDVFAMEHADILERHKVLYAASGYDPFAGMVVVTADVRRQLEFEAMGTLLRVRAAMIGADDSDKHRIELLAGSAGQILTLFRAVWRLTSTAPVADTDALCNAVATKAGFDAAPFRAVLAHRRGSVKMESAQAAELLSGYHAGLERLVAYIDTIPS